MNIYLCTYGDLRFKPTLKRFVKQANQFSIFKKIFVYTQWDLEFEFNIKFRKVLNSKHKGFGYWIWKPQVILQALKKIKFDDILIYVDCGCHLNKTGETKLKTYIENFNSSITDIMALQGNSPWSEHPDLREKTWTKGDLFDFFNVRNDQNYTDTNQFQATIIFFKKTNNTIAFVKKWESIFYQNFSLVDDTPSKSINLDSFIEHRYDQSIFSLLCKLNKNVISIPITDTWNSDLGKLHDFPFWAIRDKKMTEPLKTRIYQRLKTYFLK
jgi:hypothetical protein